MSEIAYPCKRSVTQFVAEVWNWLWPKVEHIFIKSEDSPETAELIRQLPTEDQAKVLVPHWHAGEGGNNRKQEGGQ